VLTRPSDSATSTRHATAQDEHRASETVSDTLLLLGKAAASVYLVALLLCANSNTTEITRMREALFPMPSGCGS
jgi:hypothetical protein